MQKRAALAFVRSSEARDERAREIAMSAAGELMDFLLASPRPTGEEISLILGQRFMLGFELGVGLTPEDWSEIYSLMNSVILKHVHSTWKCNTWQLS